MRYDEEKVMQAFSIYTTLARNSVACKETVQLYKNDDHYSQFNRTIRKRG